MSEEIWIIGMINWMYWIAYAWFLNHIMYLSCMAYIYAAYPNDRPFVLYCMREQWP